MLQTLDVRPGLRYCDAAAGGGFVAEGIDAVLGGDCRITCLENSDEWLKLINPRFTPTFSSLSDIQMPDDSVDRVSCLAGMHHQEHKIDFVREAARVLAPGGRLAFADVLEGSDVAAWLNGPVDRATKPLGHDGMFLAHGEPSRLMAEIGLQEVHEQYHEYSWDFTSVPEMVAYCKHLFRMGGMTLAEYVAQTAAPV